MISVSRTFHAWCGLIPSKEIIPDSSSSSLPISTLHAQVLVSNCTYQAIIKRYQLNLKDKDCLRQQVDNAILNWKNSWFTTSGGGGRGGGSVEEEIITDVTNALILGTSDSNFSQAHSLDHFNEEYIVVAMLLVS